MASKKMSLHLVVDKETHRVVWAESGGDVVNVLFSFLALPLGTVVRLLGKQSGLGRVDELYKSVEGLDESCFQTPCCRDMLLRPRSSSEWCCMDLPVRVDDEDVRTFYTCQDKNCIEHGPGFSFVYSAVRGATCRCLGTMDSSITWRGSTTHGANGAFVEAGGRFTISDDLCVSPASASATINALLGSRGGCKGSNILQHMDVELTREQVLTLLQKSLSSKTPLTEMFLQKSDGQQMEQLHPTAHEEGTTCATEFKASLVISRARNKVLCAEVGGDIVDLVFSFLTMPIGSIIRLLGKGSHIGCMGNLYSSVENLCATKYFPKLEQHKDLLLDPKIAPHFGCRNQLLDVEEADSSETTMNERMLVVFHNLCSRVRPRHKVQKTVMEINPKLGNGGTNKGGGFAKGTPDMFMITDEMVVTVNSSVSALEIMDGPETSVDDIEEREVTLGEKEALGLLRALLLSRTPLTDVFCPRKEKGVRRRLGSLKIAQDDGPLCM